MNIRLSILLFITASLLAQSNKAISQQGLQPGVIAQSSDYGTCLYGTVRDSFVVVKNTGSVSVTIDRITPYGPDTDSFRAFPKGSVYTNPTSGERFQYPDTGLVLYKLGMPGDSARYPYHFYARKLGVNIDSLNISNSSPNDLQVALSGNVVQPYLGGKNVNLTDTVRPLDTVNVVTHISNSGTAALTIDSLFLWGPDTDAWKILSIHDSITGDTIPWHSSRVKMLPNDVWSISLQFAPRSLGSFWAQLRITGYDNLGRHSNDSITSFYNWGKFPYDADDTLTAVIYGPIGAVNERSNENALPANIILSQNYPNPFNSATTFTFTASQSRDYRIEIFNDHGAKIVSLPTSKIGQGKYSAAWDASGWASGVYYYRVSEGTSNDLSHEAKSFLLLR